MASAKFYVSIKSSQTTFRVLQLLMLLANFMLTQSVPLMNTACETEKCRSAAEEISARMDKKIDPCDNFYQFVCGNYVKDDSKMVEQMRLFPRMKNNSVFMLGSVLANNYDDGDPKPFRLVSKLYQLCMDQSTRVEEGVRPLQKILQELGGWPLLEGEKWKDTGKSWLTINRDLIQKGYYLDLFLRLHITRSPNTNRRVIMVNSPFTSDSLPRDLIRKAVKLGARKDVAENTVLTLYNFETEFRKIIDRTKSSNIERFKLDELQRRWPKINWNIFFSSVLTESLATPINETEEILVNTSFIDEFVHFIIDTTPLKILMNYALSRVVGKSWIYIRDDDTIYASFDQSKLCIDILYNDTPVSLSIMFAAEYVNDNERNEIFNMVNTVRDLLVADVQQDNRLDTLSVKRATEKLRSLKSMVGYEDEWENKGWLGKLYGDIQLSSNNFLRSILSVKQFKKMYEYRTGLNHIDDQISQIVQFKIPSYKSSQNKIKIGAENLQDPLFNSQLPKYMNYGGIGFVMSHEIAHSLQFGESYDDGTFTVASKSKLTEKKNCFINQYSEYFFAEMRQWVNGKESFAENIADNIGIKLAYSAYTTNTANIQPEPNLSNLPYTPKQMFWISWASNWCKRIGAQERKSDISKNSYSPSEFRIIGAASNSVQFSADFACAVGSKMNPATKCSILN